MNSTSAMIPLNWAIVMKPWWGGEVIFNLWSRSHSNVGLSTLGLHLYTAANEVESHGLHYKLVICFASFPNTLIPALLPNCPLQWIGPFNRPLSTVPICHKYLLDAAHIGVIMRPTASAHSSQWPSSCLQQEWRSPYRHTACYSVTL